MLIWQLLHPQMTVEHLGSIPSFVTDADARPAKEQFDERYISGWEPIDGFTLSDENVLQYPGDPSFVPRALVRLRDELIVFYDHAFVAIIQPDRSFEVCRMD